MRVSLFSEPLKKCPLFLKLYEKFLSGITRAWFSMSVGFTFSLFSMLFMKTEGYQMDSASSLDKSFLFEFSFLRFL